MNIHEKLQRNFVGGIVSGIGNMIGGLINAGTQRKVNADNLRAQREENALNRQHAEDMYNKYESPVAQRQQMLEAGLNPMGAISPNAVSQASTSSLPNGPAPEWGSAIQSGIDTFYSSAMAIKELRNKDLEATEKELDIWKKAFENGNAEEQYELTKQEIQGRIALSREERRLKKREIRHLDFVYKKAKEAYDEGANEFKDAHQASEDSHNESVGRTLLLGKELETFDEKMQMYREEHSKRIEQFNAQNYKLWNESMLLQQQTLNQELANIERSVYGMKKAKGEAAQYDIQAYIARLESIKTQIDLYKAECQYYLGKANLSLEQKKAIQDYELAIKDLEFKYTQLAAQTATNFVGEIIPF